MLVLASKMATKDETFMLPPPPPSIKLSKRSSRTPKTPPIQLEDGEIRGEDNKSLLNIQTQSTFPEEVTIELDTDDGSSTVFLQTDDMSYIGGLDIETDLDHFIRPPSPSVIEVPVPPKPPPEVIDLLDDDQVKVPGRDEQQHIQVYVPLTLEKTLANYALYFPREQPKLEEIKWICHDLLLLHEIKGFDAPPPYDSIQLKTMAINYLNHLMYNHKELHSCISSIKEELPCAAQAWCTWGMRTRTNAYIETFVGQFPSAREPMCTPENPKQSWNLILPFLVEGKTELQSILNKKYSQQFHRGTRNEDFLWNVMWSPVNLSMPFDLFLHAVCNKLDPSTKATPAYLRLFKKWYIEHMYKTALSSLEFLLAVISAFGTSIKFYPARVLEFFHQRDMLKSNCRLSGMGFNDFFARTNDDLILPNRNKATAEHLRQEVIQTLRNTPPVTKVPFLKERFLFSLERFAMVAQLLWSNFYGKGQYIPDSTLNKWYHNFDYLSKFDDQLQAVLKHIVTENPKSYLPIVKKITPAETTQLIQKLKLESENRQKLYFGTNALSQHNLTPQTLMESNSSCFQLSLMRNHLVPLPTAWSPTKCFLPYELFKALLDAKMKLAGISLRLSIDAIKVRYVEFMAEAFKTNVTQIFLAVFSAIGPDMTNLSLRILHILQETKLMRQDLGLPLCDSLCSSQVYKPLDQNFRKRRAQPTQEQQPSPKRLAANVQASSNFSAPVFQNVQNWLNNSSNTGETAGNTSIRTPSITLPAPKNRNTGQLKKSKPSTPNNFNDWTKLSEQALMKFDLPALSTRVSREAFAAHTTRGRSNGFFESDFMKGMQAGIDVAIRSYREHRVQQTLESTTEAQARAARVFAQETIGTNHGNSTLPSLVQNSYFHSYGNQWTPNSVTNNYGINPPLPLMGYFPYPSTIAAQPPPPPPP